MQGRNDKAARGAQFPGRQIIMGASNHCGGRQMSAAGAEKSQQRNKCFLQYSKFPSEWPQVRTRGRQTCFLPRAPSNVVTSLLVCFMFFSLLKQFGAYSVLSIAHSNATIYGKEFFRIQKFQEYMYRKCQHLVCIVSSAINVVRFC